MQNRELKRFSKLRLQLAVRSLRYVGHQHNTLTPILPMILLSANHLHSGNENFN